MTIENTNETTGPGKQPQLTVLNKTIQFSIVIVTSFLYICAILKDSSGPDSDGSFRLSWTSQGEAKCAIIKI